MNRPVRLSQVKITDEFWKQEIELVRTEVIPYQWDALNDRIPGAEPSFAVRNFKLAARLQRARRENPDFKEPVFGDEPYVRYPKDPLYPEDRFYGFLFQDSDLYKWIEAVAYSLTNHPDTELEAQADGLISLIADAQEPDGYLDTFYILNGRNKEFTNLRSNHELYIFGHMAEAAVAYYEATGKDKLLRVAERFEDYIASKIGPEDGKKHGYPGHEEAELALVKMYEATGKQKYLDQAAYYINERGKAPNYFAVEGTGTQGNQDLPAPYAYHQAHKPVREQDEAVGHSVRAAYLYCGMADVARYTKDPTLIAACERLFDNISKKKMYITGGIGSTAGGEAFTGNYDLPNDTAYTESCAAIGLALFARRMLQNMPKAEYGDVMERALYNNVLSGMALDGKSFFYVNPLEIVPATAKRDPNKRHVKSVRQKWFGCACCPPNIARAVSSIGSFAYTENAGTLFVNLYISSVCRKAFGGHTATVRQEVKQENGKIIVRLLVSDGEGMSIGLRNPEWCDGPVLKNVNPEHRMDDMGYTYVVIDSDEQEIIWELPYRVRIIAANSRVREDYGKIALQYGPFVYALEEADNGPDLHLLNIPKAIKPEDIAVSFEEIAGRRTRVLKVYGYRATPSAEQDALYTDYGIPERTPVTLKFIPYFMWANRGENEMQVFVRVE